MFDLEKSISDWKRTLRRQEAFEDGNHGFMGSILVADQGKVVFAKGYGLANVEKNIPNTPENQFKIGSISKQFTAMLITQLLEQGKLKLEPRKSAGREPLQR